MSKRAPQRRTGGVASFARSVGRRVAALRAHPMLDGNAALELWTEFRGGHAIGDDYQHLCEAIAWLVRAQDASGGGGIARGYSLVSHAEFGRGWQPAYPETTGYIIPTLFAAADLFDREELAERALNAARWEVAVQLPNGAVRGGTMAAKPSPAIFNTGQVIFGWLSALEHQSDAEIANAVTRACDFLVAVQDADGCWRRGQSQFADGTATLYNARTAWALAEAGHRMSRADYRDSAERALRVVARAQHANGWIPSCCLNDPHRPLLHTLAYATRGLVEGGRVLNNAELMNAGMRTARAIAAAVRPDGWLPGRFDHAWRPGARWSCLTGNVQMANVWLRLHAITGDTTWLEPVDRVIAFVKSTQNRTTDEPGIRGGIKGALPVTGEYGRLEILSWATKFFADALMRSMARSMHAGPPGALALA